MANYYGTGRTNYVKVDDVGALTEAVSSFADVALDREGRVALIDNNADGGGWLFQRYDEEEGEYVDVDIVDVVAPHLLEDEVMVVMEAGAEKHRYVSGWAMAFNSAGERVNLTLNDIYAQAATLGKNVTDAAY